MSSINQLSTIKVKYEYSSHTGWGRYLLYLLSKDPRVTRIRDSSIQFMPVFKGQHLIPFQMNDRQFFIDDWDYHYPTSSLINSSIPDHYLQDIRPTILKIQYHTNDKNLYDQLYEKYKIKVEPFIIFPNTTFNLEFETWKYNDNIEYLCFHSGRVWGRERGAWVDYLNKCNLKIPKIDSPGLPEKEFENLLLKTKWGLILKGKGVGKNRREIEYISIGMPLALNYQPQYPFPYNANEHYVYLEKPSDIEKLVDIDPKPYAEKSMEIYNKYYSVKTGGIYNSFNNAYLKALESI